jgi:hypothetical protein
MAGYLVLPEEACDWSGNQPDKIKPNPTRFGLADLVRQFEQVPFPFSRLTPGVCLHGLDAFLIELKLLEDVNETRDWLFLQQMRRRLCAVAGEVNNMSTIQVPIRHSLVLGDGNHLFVNYAGKRIPLWRLFGSNPDIGSEGGFKTYFYGVNLS